MPEQKPSDYLHAFSSLVLLIIIGYGVDRHQTFPLFFCYFTLFLLYILVLRRANYLRPAEVSFWLFASVLYRAALLFSTPELSDDAFRFVWDGRLLAQGHSPFAEVPSYYMQPSHAVPGLDEVLYGKLNSKHRYSSYPPVCQLIYWLSVKLSPDSIHGSILVMKNLLFIFEMGTIWMLRKLIRDFALPPASVLVYALNPLVILEITGNLHFEGVMIFFLLVAVYFLVRRKLFLSFTTFALSVCTKLIPLIFLPLLFHSLGWKKAVTYWIMTAMMVGILFLPLLNEDIIHGFSTSLGYYFQRFEFNASLYYLIREVGFWIFGFNIIQVVGPLLAVAAAMLIFDIAFRQLRLPLSAGISHSFFEAMVWCLLVYFLSTTILHPWYIITLLVVSIFTEFRFPVVWTGVIFLTYAGYSESLFTENMFWVTVEYLVVIGYILYETLWVPRKSHS